MRRLLVSAAVFFALAFVLNGVAGAATAIVAPTGNPYHAQLDASGKVIPFTVVASGFQPDANVFAEQCDGRVPSDPHWRPQVDCDLGSAPPPAIADAHGKVTFTAADPNSGILFFHGESPQHIFNCLTQGEPSPKNNLTDYRTCQIRVSTNNSDSTNDQVFVKFTLGPTPTSTSSKAVLAVVVVAIAAVVVIAVLLIGRRRSSVKS